jgi:hypothetical protein
MPPRCPLLYVTRVKICSTTAEAVKVGYTSGYYQACVTHGSGHVVVYGSGYLYTPWIGSVWFGPSVTCSFGSGSTYTSWSGWSFNFGFGWS